MSSPQTPSRAKTYNRVKFSIGVVSALLSLILMLALVLSGLSRAIADWSLSISPHRTVALLLFAAVVSLMQSALTLPLGFLSGYAIEHRYGLSNQSLARWTREQVKGLLIVLPLAVLVVILLYACLTTYGPWWWLPVGAALTLLSVVIARIAPVIIFPLFYTFRPVGPGTLRDRILRLCSAAGLTVEGIYTFDLSKNTRKANAAFAGIGRSRRIILGDTLVKEFSEDEIETVFAHELGHYHHHHIRTGILVGTLSTFLGLAVTARLYEWSSALLGFPSLTDLGALPLLALWLSLFAAVTSPLGNMLSRRNERQADAYAVRMTGNPGAFVGALRKLASQNLTDPDPHPIIEFLFHSHPSITRRITLVEAAGRG